MTAVTADGALPAPHAAVVFRAVSDGAVLLHMEEEVYYGLNTVGARIWQLLAECADLDTLSARLGESYPEVPPESLRQDVQDLLEMLGEAGLVVARQ